MNYRDPKTNFFRDTMPSDCAGGRRDTADDVDGGRVRKSHPLNQILPATTRWVGSLPASSRPIEMLKAYPRVANRIASGWRDPRSARDVLDDLLIDHRGRRQGFPPFVLMELLRLEALLDSDHTNWFGEDRGSPSQRHSSPRARPVAI
jgi:hypothetical protein